MPQAHDCVHVADKVMMLASSNSGVPHDPHDLHDPHHLWEAGRWPLKQCWQLVQDESTFVIHQEVTREAVGGSQRKFGFKHAKVEKLTLSMTLHDPP